MDELLSAQYLIALDNSHPSNFTMVPNIIDHLTYYGIDKKTGETQLKRLSVFAAHLYRVLIHIGGDEHVTWKNSEHLAEIANMSVGQVVKCKQELLQKFIELDGNSLIEVTEHKKAKVKDGEKICGYVYHKIIIKNIWGFNRAFFLLKKVNTPTDSPHEPATPTDSPHEPASRRTDSPGERNNTPCSKTPLFKEQHSTPSGDSVCSSDIEDSVVSPQTKMFNWLMQIGCDLLGAKKIIDNFTPQDLYNASGYIQKIMLKKKIQNVAGYLRKTLEGRWWEKNVSQV